jgi:hypothetical protein
MRLIPMIGLDRRSQSAGFGLLTIPARRSEILV